MSTEHEEFCNWVDTEVLVEAIFDGLETCNIPLTAENAKKVWLDMLAAEIPDGIIRSVGVLIEKGELKEV